MKQICVPIIVEIIVGTVVAHLDIEGWFVKNQFVACVDFNWSHKLHGPIKILADDLCHVQLGKYISMSDWHDFVKYD